MPKRKTQKVRFQKGDKRPSSLEGTLSYTKRMKKKGKDIIWQVVEKPTNNVVSEYFFEEDASLPLKKNVLATNSNIHEELKDLIDKKDIE